MKIITFGEHMLRLSPPFHQRFEQTKSLDIEIGGSEANVAVLLAQLGMDVSYVSRVPDNSLGLASLASLNKFGVNTKSSVLGGDRIGIYFLEMGAGKRSSRIIYDRAHSGMYSLAPGMIDWAEIFKDGGWFHWSGITPAVSASAAKACMEALEIAQKNNIIISCDLNYRANLWKYGSKPADIMPELIEKCHIIMGDMDVMDIYFGMHATDMTDCFEKLKLRFQALQYICMSQREGLSASHNTYKGFLFDGKIIAESKKYDLPDIIDRIGSGDSLMGGLIYQLRHLNQKPIDLQYAIEFATATGAFKHYVAGDFNIVTENEIIALAKGHTGGKVKR